MGNSEIIANVNAENLYQHILKTEGVKHTLDAPEALEECADYILEQFQSYDLDTNEQKFKIDGFDYEFRNIEAWLGDGKDPELLIISHYDTVWKAPGANDNGTAISVMLEAAKILAKTDITGVRFVSFNLEEGNPQLQQAWRDFIRSIGFVNKSLLPTSLKARQVLRKYAHSMTQSWLQGKNAESRCRYAIESIKDDISKEEYQSFQNYLQDFVIPHEEDRFGLMGSSHWVEKAVGANHEVSGVLCLETMGYTSKEPNSQTLPASLDRRMIQGYNTDESLTVGDFIAVVADKNSGELAQSFCNVCKNEAVDLPYALIHVPLGYDEIRKAAPDLLRSDHSPFWKENIPGLMITDTADFRYPYYHTEADTIDKLDFEFLEKVCKATVGTALTFE